MSGESVSAPSGSRRARHSGPPGWRPRRAADHGPPPRDGARRAAHGAGPDQGRGRTVMTDEARDERGVLIRAVRQRLEALGRAGVDRVPISLPMLPVPTVLPRVAAHAPEPPPAPPPPPPP